jgi:negative regulator of flagellin synthesis FlgM
MRISTGTPMIETPALPRVDDTEAAAPAPAAPAAPAGLQSAVLQPALAALRAMPDIDHAKVAALRDALAKGELPFDPARLAGLVQRFHGSGK